MRGFVLLLLLPAAIFTSVLLWGKYENSRTSPPPPGERGALVWSDGQVIFANTNEVAAWVKQHGGTFKAFKQNHPAALSLVTRHHVAKTRTKLAAGTKKAAPVKVTPAAATNRQAVAATPATSDGGGVRTSSVALGGLAALLIILAFLPTGLLWQIRLFRTERMPELRLVLGAASIAITAGLALGGLI